MWWALNYGTVDFEPPNQIGNFTITIDEDCQINGGEGHKIVG